MVAAEAGGVVLGAVPENVLTGATTLVGLRSAISETRLLIAGVMIIAPHGRLLLVGTDPGKIFVLGIGHLKGSIGVIDGDRDLLMEGTGDTGVQALEIMGTTMNLTFPTLEELHGMFQLSRLLLLKT